ncbi:MAG: hypothetical protein QOH11_416 [Solirubrobacteraceae bacterium]|jgi:hypothetical protein|nr:hypothetical protein [Solirubrobacteraceae bacterium]
MTRPHSRIRAAVADLAPWVPAAISCAAIVVVAVLLIHTFWGDPSIYLSYARNFARGDLFRFDPGGQFSSGVASPLWEGLLSVPFVFGGGSTGARVWSLAIALVAFVVVVGTAHRLTRSALAAGFASFFLVSAFALYAALGYDSAVVISLAALSIVAGESATKHFEEGRVDVRSVLPLLAVWAALPLARPDASVLVVLELVALATAPPARGRRKTLLLMGAAALAAMPAFAYYGYSQLTLGSYTVSNSTRAIDQKRAADSLGPLLYSKPAFEYLASIWYALLLAAIGIWRFWSTNGRRWLAIYAGTAIAAYCLLLVFYPVTFYMQRYFLPVAAFIAVGIAQALVYLWRRRLVGIGAVILSVLLLTLSLRDAVDSARQQRAKPYSFNEIMERGVTTRLNQIAPRHATVLAYEVQARFLLRDDLRLLSLNGITDGKVAPYRPKRDMAAFLQRYRPTYWIANDPVKTLPYTRSSILDTVIRRYESNPRQRTIGAAGIRFELIARRPHPPPVGFAGWRFLFKLGYS